MKPSDPAPVEVLHHRGDEPHLLREIVRTHQVLMAGFAREVGMPSSRFALMRLLAVSEQSELGVTELAKRLGVNAAAVTRQVKELEEERLVLRRSDLRDGRRSYVKLSAKGRRLFAQIHERSHQLERSLSAVIDAGDMETAARVLMTVRELIEGLRGAAKGEMQ
ncbi:MAG: MarR family transcriptional regulator [Deltaproteobacteria bacterium]|nr:MarR family transcriptional regulator [Deltaproteobacteria bacterium]